MARLFLCNCLYITARLKYADEYSGLIAINFERTSIDKESEPKALQAYALLIYAILYFLFNAIALS